MTKEYINLHVYWLCLTIFHLYIHPMPYKFHQLLNFSVLPTWIFWFSSLELPQITWPSFYKNWPSLALGSVRQQECSGLPESRGIFCLRSTDMARGGAVTTGEMLPAIPVSMDSTASFCFPNFTFPKTLQPVAARIKGFPLSPAVGAPTLNPGCDRQ